MTNLPLILGHRGAPFAARENTVAAFRAALDDGADGVELDVQATADGSLALFHDTRVDEKSVHHWRFADLRARLGALDTLEDALAALPADAWVFVEVKRQNAAHEALVLDRIATLLEARGAARTILGSFDPLVAKIARLRGSGLTTGLIVDADTRGASTAPAPAPDAVDVVSMHFALAKTPYLGACAQRTLAWPIGAELTTDADLDAALALAPALGGIITKRPGVARARWERA